jgi:hypothetical protein
MSEKFKVPKPRTYTGDNEDRDASTLDAWIQQVKDCLELSKINHEKDQLLVLQYFLGETAKEFYHTKRMEEGMTFDTFLTKLKEHIIPSTEGNRYWDDWYKISQVRNGRVDRITATAIRLEMIASHIGSTLSEHVKIERFLDAMHPDYAMQWNQTSLIDRQPNGTKLND